MVKVSLTEMSGSIVTIDLIEFERKQLRCASKMVSSAEAAHSILLTMILGFTVTCVNQYFPS